MIYTDLLTLVIDVAVRFYKTCHGSSGEMANLDMHEVFGDTISSFRRRCEEVNQAIWKDQIAGDDADADNGASDHPNIPFKVHPYLPRAFYSTECHCLAVLFKQDGAKDDVDNHRDVAGTDS